MRLARERDARKSPISGEELRALIDKENVRLVLVASGQKVIELRPDATWRDRTPPQLLGRVGTLRAPTVLIGDTLYVGFNEELYRRLAAETA
ncbi:MAG: hypothetical protein LBU39_06430 [Desulfobulbaceae bacterium]|jgi:arsenate reductase-like glutaredoxin family protein|nr:hypothetical protein [Desulfobulbaceae bacterium]